MRELSARSNWTSVAEPLVLLSTRSLAVLSPTAWSSKTDFGSVTAPLQRGAPLEREPGTSPGDQGKANPAELLGHLALSWLFSHPIPSHHRLSVPLELAKPLGWLAPSMTSFPDLRRLWLIAGKGSGRFRW